MGKGVSIRSAVARYFSGRTLNQGAAHVLVEATVKDSAGHSETRGEPVTVSESPLLITAVPEGGTLIPGIENQVFVLTSYADGKPARTELRVRAAGNAEQGVTTDDGGVALVSLAAASTPTTLEIEARIETAIAHRVPSRWNLARARSRFCCAPSVPCIAPGSALSCACFLRGSKEPCTWTR